MKPTNAPGRSQHWVRGLATLAFASLAVGCAAEPGLEGADDPEFTPDAVTVDTSTPAARAQYDANVRFATQYRARCVARTSLPRALVTGFGRFLTNTNNATGRVVSALVPAAAYPETQPPAAGAVDPPGAQTSVGTAIVDLPGVGRTEMCAMILPVYWDLAAILVIKELQSFAPGFVLMNGIAGEAQPLWLELGAINRAMVREDGSDLLRPSPPPGEIFAPLVPSATSEETLQGLLLSWTPVQDAVRDAIAANADVLEDGVPFGDIAQGVLRGGFPRFGNTYLCNNIAYVVNYAMGHPGRSFTLLQASRAVRGAVNRVPVRLTRDMRTTPRVFVHWPSALAGAHVDAGADVMRALLGAQLGALRNTSAPTLGTNAAAEIEPSGDTY